MLRYELGWHLCDKAFVADQVAVPGRIARIEHKVAIAVKLIVDLAPTPLAEPKAKHGPERIPAVGLER
jgi:hypothetical protein